MNAERLIELYDRIAEAPDAVSRLRSLVLSLAVQGKLSHKLDNDEPVSVLLAQMRKNRDSLVKEKQIKKQKNFGAISDEECPVRIPNHWAWARLSEVGSLGGGATPSKSRSEYWDGNILWVSPKDMKSDELTDSADKISATALEETRLEVFPPGCLFIVARSGILKRKLPVCINKYPATANQDLKVLCPYAEGQERYLQIMLLGFADFILRELVKTGTTVQSLKYAEFEAQPFPIPPAQEQHRIVAKVDELMALCDRLEATHNTREATRDRLTTASLARLTATDGDDWALESAANFVLGNLSRITNKSAQVDMIRRTIIDLAVRGRLHAADQTSESAAYLLERSQQEIDAYAKLNKIRQANVDLIEPDDEPFRIPPNWKWTRLAHLFRVITDGDHQAPPRAESGVAFLTIGNITTGHLLFDGCRLVPEDYFDAIAGYRKPQYGDILYTVVGATFGRPAPVDTDRKFCVQRHIAILKPVSLLAQRFLLLLLSSPSTYEQAARSTTGTAQPTIPLTRLRNFAVPLPPVAEQHRIVAKVDELMALCDRLEASLQQAHDKRARLLDALLAEALAPSSDEQSAA